MNITGKELAVYCDLVYDIYKTKANFFGEEDEFKEAFYIAASHSLIDIANYAKKVHINITELEVVKILVFSIKHLQNTKFNFNIERYIRSIFSYLEQTYAIKFDRDELHQSIKVCENLINEDQTISVYTFIKGAQEGARAERNV
ncbi:MAG: hypothetical protein FE834_02310 [Gammaproteobacteria bacterium]|nr:hypothetical protein [Gammaproteobacteria bacterium]